jgi:iron complex outermembrane receptor protein
MYSIACRKIANACRPAIIALAFTGYAAAQSTTNGSVGASSGSQLEEITITAQRHEQNLQQVPIAVTAFSASQLVNSGITGTEELANVVPGLTFTTIGPSGSVFIRGIGSNAGNVDQEPSVATYVDDVYIASPTANQFEFNNIDQIAVLKGPQGTLFGRNATGGVIQITTRDPGSSPRLDIEGGYGNYDTFKGSIYASAPIASTLAADIAITGQDQGSGWGHNLTTSADNYKHDSVAARSKWLWTPDDATRVRLSMDYEHTKIYQTPDLSLPGEFGVDGRPNYAGFFNSLGNSPSFTNRTSGGLSVRFDRDFGYARLVSISAYRDLSNTFEIDEDKTPLNIVDATLSEYSRTLSQEFQLLSPRSSKIDWLAGAFLYHVNAGVEPATIAGLAAAPLPYLNIFTDLRTKSGSVFGQGTAAIFTDTHLTLGYRYTVERQQAISRVDAIVGNIVPAIFQKQGFDKGTWRVALDRQLTPDVLAYISYNRGIKSGGYDILSPGAPGYKPEQLDAYEIGLKNEFLDHRFRVNSSAFYYNYQNIQEEEAITGGVITVNAAKARIYGADLDVSAKATEALTLTISGTYLHSEYLAFSNPQEFPGNPGLPVPDPNVVGSQTTQAPKYTAHAGANYRVLTEFGALDVSGDYSYNSGFFWDSANRLAQPNYSLLNSALSWTSVSEVYGVRLWGKNLTNKEYYAGGITSSGLGDLMVPAAPRTYGITFSAHF